MFLYEIITKIENMAENEIKSPSEEGCDGEYVGNMSDYLKKLYTLRKEFRAKLAESMSNLILADTRETAHGHHHSVTTITHKLHIIDEIFWIDLRDEFALDDCKYPGLSVRKDWRVYAHTGNEESEKD